MNKKQLIQAAAFLLLLALILVPVNKLFSRPLNDHNYQMITGFYEEPEGSLDAVYVGSSNCFTFWNPLFAWEEFGIAVYNYACDAFPFEATSYIIEEARKTQPEALFLVNLNTLHDSGIRIQMTHYLLDNMPMSRNRIALTERLAEAAGWDFDDRMELYFPILRFHFRWSELQMNDFGFATNRLKGTITFQEYVDSASNISDAYHVSAESTVPNDWMMDCVEDLLAYCDETDVNILFLVVPRAESEESVVTQLNYVQAYIEERGYPVLNMLNDPDAVGLDLTGDFYNSGHTNIHGSLKVTRYIGRYLVDNYGFTDKRGEEAYASWDKARSRYDNYILPNTLDIEFSGKNRDYSLSCPKNAAAILSGDTVHLSWGPSEGAEGYRVYRRLGEDVWELLAEVTEPGWEDSPDVVTKSPLYRIVPFRMDSSGEPRFGHFFTPGFSVTTG